MRDVGRVLLRGHGIIEAEIYINVRCGTKATCAHHNMLGSHVWSVCVYACMRAHARVYVCPQFTVLSRQILVKEVRIYIVVS